jgi:hypothetical protein
MKSIVLSRFIFALFTTSVLAGCEGVGVSLSNVGETTFATGTLAVTTFQGASESAWKVDGTGKVYSTSSMVLFAGTCSRGVAKIYLYVNNVVATNSAACRNDGTFTIRNDVSGDGTYALRFSPTYADGKEISSAVVAKSLEVDSTAPMAPVITNTTHVTTNPSFTLNGTTPSNDTIEVIPSDTTGNLIFAASAFSGTYTLTPGQTKTYTFYAKDFAGNLSAGTTYTMSYIAGAFLAVTDFGSTAVNLAIPDNGGSGKTLESPSGSSYLLSVNPMVGSDGTRLTTGIVRVGN